ncbi:hypothetical protein BS78_04G104400 [Paspalum vaginatum]|nr:hypothetical protein BS78_04G104400 [Paspalum vaginatum]
MPEVRSSGIGLPSRGPTNDLLLAGLVRRGESSVGGGARGGRPPGAGAWERWRRQQTGLRRAVVVDEAPPDLARGGAELEEIRRGGEPGRRLRLGEDGVARPLRRPRLVPEAEPRAEEATGAGGGRRRESALRKVAAREKRKPRRAAAGGEATGSGGAGERGGGGRDRRRALRRRAAAGGFYERGEGGGGGEQGGSEVAMKRPR